MQTRVNDESIVKIKCESCSCKMGKTLSLDFFYLLCWIGALLNVSLLLPDVVSLVFMTILVTRTFKAQVVARCVNEHLQARDR